LPSGCSLPWSSSLGEDAAGAAMSRQIYVVSLANGLEIKTTSHTVV